RATGRGARRGRGDREPPGGRRLLGLHPSAAGGLHRHGRLSAAAAAGRLPLRADDAPERPVMTLVYILLLGVLMGFSMALPLAFALREQRHSKVLRTLLAQAEEINREHISLYQGMINRLVEISRALEAARSLSARNNPDPAEAAIARAQALINENPPPNTD